MHRRGLLRLGLGPGMHAYIVRETKGRYPALNVWDIDSFCKPFLSLEQPISI